MIERWDAYTAAGERTGEILLRGNPIPPGRYHLVAEVLLRHRNGRWLLMRRAPEKDYCPGMWEASAGGSAQLGEDSAAAARREVLEETGLHIHSLQTLYHERGDGYLFDYFLAVTDDDPAAVQLQAGETTDYRWIDTAALLARIDADQCMHARMLRLCRSCIESL